MRVLVNDHKQNIFKGPRDWLEYFTSFNSTNYKLWVYQIALDEFTRHLFVECKDRGIFFSKLWKGYQTELLENVNTLIGFVEENYKTLNLKLQNTLEKFEMLETEHEMIVQNMVEQNKLITKQKSIIENSLQIIHNQIKSKLDEAEEIKKFDGYIEMFFPNFK